MNMQDFQSKKSKLPCKLITCIYTQSMLAFSTCVPGRLCAAAAPAHAIAKQLHVVVCHVYM